MNYTPKRMTQVSELATMVVIISSAALSIYVKTVYINGITFNSLFRKPRPFDQRIQDIDVVCSVSNYRH